MRRTRAFPALLIGGVLASQPPATGTVQQLSLQEAIRITLENNLQVGIARESRTATAAAIPIAQGAFDWNLVGNLNYGRQESANTKLLYPLGPLATTDTLAWNRSLTIGAQRPFEWGGNFQVSYNPAYNFSQGNYQNPNSGAYLGYFSSKYSYSGTLTGTYTQSLLKGFGRQVNEVYVIVAKKGSQAAEHQFSLAVINLVASAESQYWDVVYAARNLDNAKAALALAQQQLDEDNAKVKEGTLAGIEVTNAEAAVAQRKQALVVTKSQLRNANDALLRILYPNAGHPDRIEPTDTPDIRSEWADLSSAEKMAVERRLELKVARLGLESLSAQRVAAENRLLPQLNTFLSYNAGSDNRTTLGLVNTDLFNPNFPGYTVGLTFAFPIANRTAKGTLAQARANERGSQLSLRDLELGILLQVRQAFENVEASRDSVVAARLARIFREADLDGEHKKFENGMSTTFLVLAKQNDLDASKAVELQAQIGYAKSVTALEQATGNLVEARGFSYPR